MVWSVWGVVLVALSACWAGSPTAVTGDGPSGPVVADGPAPQEEPKTPPEAPRERDRRRGARVEWVHKDSGQHFLGPKRWIWRDPDNHFKVNKIAMPPDARSYMPCAIMRIKPLDKGVTFPMIVKYAEYRLRKLIDVDKVIENAPTTLPFENQGAHVLHVTGKIERRGTPVECRQIVYLRGQWFTVIACGSALGDFADHQVEFDELINGITFDPPKPPK